MTEDQRSAVARARAERALAWLLAGLDGADTELIVLGGLVPEILTRGRNLQLPGHLGTTDVDILLVTHVGRREDLGAVERSLRKLDFIPGEDGWRWHGDVDGSRVRIEFLCDLDDLREGELARPAGCEQLMACNLRGTGYVALDWEWETIRSTTPDGERIDVRARFAGLEGYLLSKCVAARIRAAEKDYYDLPYVLIHNREGGPRQAAERLLAGKLQAAILGLGPTIREVAARYSNPSDFAPGCYASQMRLVEPALDEVTLRADAVVAVAEFAECLSTPALRPVAH